jgi:integrase
MRAAAVVRLPNGADPARLPDGVEWDAAQQSFRASVRVRPFPLQRKRFSADTPLQDMIEWRIDQQAALQASRKSLDRDARRSRGAADGGVLETPLFPADVETYVADKLRDDLHPKTRDAFLRYLAGAAAAFPDKTRDELTAADWIALVERWEKRGIPSFVARAAARTNPHIRPRRCTAPGPITMNKVRTCFIGFYRDMDRGRTPARVNPAQAIPRRQPPADEPRGFALEDGLAILQHVAWRPSRARLTLVMLAGLREIEVMRIDPRRHWKRRAGVHTLFVPGTKKGRGGTQPRTLGPLPPEVVAALETLEALGKWGPFEYGALGRAFHAAVEAAGKSSLEPCRPYDCRHTFGTHVYLTTRDPKATGEALGHAPQSRMTDRYTTAAVPASIASAIGAIAAALPSASAPPVPLPPPAGAALRLVRKGGRP